MNNSPIKLYHYWRSSCSWRVRWALNLKGLTYDSIPVNLLKSEHKSTGYLAMNPAGFVPTLEFNGQQLSESVAIIEWLDEKYPSPALLPSSAIDRTFVRQLAYTVAMGIQPIQNLKVQKYISNDPAKRQAFASHFIKEGFEVYETLLNRHTPGSYSFGGTPTLADLCLIPQVYNALRFKVDMNDFPMIWGVYQRALKTPECAAAHPDNQPGATP